MKLNIITISFALISLSASACNDKPAGSAATSTEKTETLAAESPGTAALPRFRIMNAEGTEIDLQSLKGKKIFLNIWATWCGPCRREMPSINNLYKSLDTSKVAFVMLSVDDKFEKAKQYITREKFSLPVYYPVENLPTLFNVDGIPATFIFDEKGNVVKRVFGSEDYDTEEFRNLLR